MATILCIQSETTLNKMVEDALSSDPQTVVAVDGVNGMDHVVRQVPEAAPDLIVLDGALLFQNEKSACRQLRSVPRLERTPILVLTGAKTAQDIAQVLDSGCDDCVRKSIAERELAARIRALLRRRRKTSARNALLILNPLHKTVHLADREIAVTPTEYDLLEALVQYPGQHIPTASLLQIVWHYPPGGGDPALVRNHVRNLRRKLESDPDHPRIVTCFQGRGYSISGDVSAEVRPA